MIDKVDQGRVVDNPVVNDSAMRRYLDAITLATNIAKDGKGSVSAEDPNIPYSDHVIRLCIYDDEFEDKRLNDFASLLNNVDMASFFGTDELILVLVVSDTYIGK